MIRAGRESWSSYLRAWTARSSCLDEREEQTTRDVSSASEQSPDDRSLRSTAHELDCSRRKRAVRSLHRRAWAARRRNRPSVGSLETTDGRPASGELVRPPSAPAGQLDPNGIPSEQEPGRTDKDATTSCRTCATDVRSFVASAGPRSRETSPRVDEVNNRPRPPPSQPTSTPTALCSHLGQT